MKKDAVNLGSLSVTLDDLVSVVRGKAKIKFDNCFIERVEKCRKIVDDFAKHEKLLYGITTGLGNNCTEMISEEDRKICQRNTIFSHATSVGEKWNEEVVRAIMFVMLVHLGNGHSGIRLETLKVLKDMLNHNIIPIVPKHGSVGYLSLEAHIGIAMLGENKVIIDGEEMESLQALKRAGIEPIDISAKEGLSLTSGTSSVTALTALAIYDSKVCLGSSDIISSMTMEVLGGNLMAMDERLHNVRRHIHQQHTASNIRNLLGNSNILKNLKRDKIQDSLTLRAIPQLHGAAKKVLDDAFITLENELNSSVDNPLIFEKDGIGEAIMGCNADGSYLGMEADSCIIAITGVAKMSERRTNRLISSELSSLPSFLVKNPGLNNGLMIPQYSSVGILGEMRILCHPATIDNGTMSSMQEDYVSMGYNAAKKFYESVDLFRYILSTELLYSLQGYGFKEEEPSEALKALYNELKLSVPFFEKDEFYVPYIEKLNMLIKEERLVEVIKSNVPDFKY